jgi:hypothetical protein
MKHDSEKHNRNPGLVAALCHELNALAKHQEDAAAGVASQARYWASCPPSVEAHRTAARTLRADECLENEVPSLVRRELAGRVVHENDPDPEAQATPALDHDAGHPHLVGPRAALLRPTR